MIHNPPTQPAPGSSETITTTFCSLPSLPLHNPSSHIGPLTIPHTVSLLATLLRSHNPTPTQDENPNPKVHVIGFSLGAHIASALASTHPGLVTNVFMTGFNIFGVSRWRPILPGVLFTLTLLEGTITCPRETGEKIKDWMLGRKNVCDHVRVCGAAIDILFSDRELGTIDGERVRVAIVAATREGWIPKDKVESARRLFESVDYGEGHCHENGDWEGRKGKARAVPRKGLTHAWPVDEPELMGRTIRAWVERGEILEWFEDL